MQTTRYPTHDAVRRLQLDRLNALLASAKKRPYYASRLAEISLPLHSLDGLAELPLLTKADLVPTVQTQPATIFDGPAGDYVRMHQTSGTSGWPLSIRDTAEDWQWWLRCWQYVLDAADVTPNDVAMMAFSFGPFIGFWTASDALIQRGALVIPGGGLTSEVRLRMILDHRCTIVCCTPTYALHLVEVAQRCGIDLHRSDVRSVIVAGEPGGSVPAVRSRIEQAWRASVVDHAGASEVGAWGFGSRDGKGLHVIETEFIAELLRFDSQNPGGVPVSADGEEAELVLTNLGRLGGPAIRYRTGDIVRGYRNHQRDPGFLYLDGGVLGRADDMLIIRGVNIFPSSIEAIVRETHPPAEFRVTVTNDDQMDQLSVVIEGDEEDARQLAAAFRDRLAMRIDVCSAPVGTLPRFEAKARRFDDQRKHRSIPKS